MAVNDVGVEVVGLREFRDALKKLDHDFPAQMRLGFRAIAVEVAEKAARKVPVQTGKAAASVKPRASQTGAGIAAGGARAPYYPWLDFGGGKLHARGVTPGGRVGASRRPYIRKGRYLFPTIAEERDDIIERLEKVVDEATKRAGF